MKCMVCYNGSESSKKALELAKERARIFNAEIVMVTSMFKGREQDKNKIFYYEHCLEQLQIQCQNEGIIGETHLLIRGLPVGEDLVNFAREKSIDEMYLGVKKHSFLGTILFGSTAKYVIDHAPCPVVTVKLLHDYRYLRAA